jgi:LPXTG-motif cell wall-anchored protein
VTSGNQATLTQTPGAATALVNGQPVSVAVETPADLPAAQVDPEDRSPAQVQSLQVAADNLVDQLNQAAGGNSGLAVQDTPTGAAITGLLDKPVPIENTVLVEAGTKSTLFAALNQDGSVTEVQPGAVIEVLGDGQVGVVASGLTPGETAEFVIMSTPTLLGSYTVSANGTIKAQTSLPDGIGLGNHTLVVASPTVQASLGLKVSATPSTLPATGISNGSNTLQIALWLLVGGSLVAYLRRRRNILN